MNYEKIISEGLKGWWGNHHAIHTAIIAAAVYVVTSLLLLATGTVFFNSWQTYVQYVIQTQFGSASASITPPFSFLVFSVVLVIPLFFINYFLLGRLIFLAISKTRPMPTPFDLKKGIRFGILELLVSLAAMVCWYNKKWLLVLLAALAGVVLAVMGAVSQPQNWVFLAIGVLLAVLGLFAYFFVVYYNAFRLMLAEVIFVEQNKNMGESMAQAWKISDHKVWRIFAGTLLARLALGIVMAIVGIVLVVLIYLLTPPNSPFHSPELLLTSFTLIMLLNAFGQALSFLVDGFFVVELYRQIQSEPTVKPPATSLKMLP